MDARVAMIGLGPIGQAMSKRVADHGHLDKPLLLFNRTYEIAKKHAGSIVNAAAVATIAEAVRRSDIIWSCLADDAAVRETYSELQNESLKGKLFVESSTISAETIRELGIKLADAGAEFVSMPVFGEPATAAAGKLIVVPAGPAACIDRIRPILVGVVATAVIDFPDESPCKANELKLIGNVLILTTMEQIAELLVFAEKAGLGTASIERLLSALYPGGPQQHAKYAALMSSGEYHRRKAIVGTSSAIQLSEKIMSFARSLDVQLKGYEVAIQHLKEAREAAGSDSDILGIYGAVRQGSGLQFEK